jgi:hypothetical protein
MVEDNVVEEIYAVLVEQFGVGEIFLPKFRKRTVDILWKDFIKVALNTQTSEELAKYCSYSSKDNFSEGTRYKYPNITKDKSRRLWKDYLLSLINSKRCSTCNSILNISEFYISSRDGFSSRCKSCNKHYTKLNKETRATYLSINRESIALQRKAYYEANKEARQEYSRRYYRDNIEAIAKYYQINKDVISERNSTYRSRHLSEYSAYAAKRRAVKLKATPVWANLDKIKEIYRNREEGYHVDHVIPLQHPLVCGLHCEFNLQYLPASENLSKSNKFDINKQE